MRKLSGDILQIRRGIIVHGCNAQGAMGSGIAKAIREEYPGVFKDYIRLIRSNRDKEQLLGKVAETWVSDELCIASGITQLYYGRNPDIVYVNYSAVVEVFKHVSKTAVEKGLPIFFPLIGCGLANGSASKIMSIIGEVVPPAVQKTLVLLR